MTGRRSHGRLSALNGVVHQGSPHTAAQMLIIFGDTPDRIRSEAAFAKLCGACPIPASSGMTTGRHRLYRGGHRQANAALHRTVVVRWRPDQTRDHPLP